MNKDFPKHILQQMSTHKKLKALYDLARYIETKKRDIQSKDFEKLKKYHEFLIEDLDDLVKKINKEFFKINKIDYQFQVYLMNLERLLGQSTKEYSFLVDTLDEKRASKKNHMICLLDSIRSAHNVGAFFRNAECFGVQQIVLTGLSPTPDNVHVQKTAMNTCDLVSWSYERNPLEVIQKYKEVGYQVIAIETGNQATSLSDFKIDHDKVLLVFGHEQFGVSLDILNESDQVLKINLSGRKNSLNVSVTQGIVLNHLNYLLEKA